MNDDLLTLIDQLEARLRDAFLAVVNELRGDIDVPALVAALRAGDIDAAIDALNIDRGPFSRYALERQLAFSETGAVVAKVITRDRVAFRKREDENPTLVAPDLAPTAPTLPPRQPPTLSAPGGGDIVFRFDMTNPRAESKIRTEAATRITGYVDEQIETARRIIGDGFQRGQSPQTIATDIAGRINPISGRREGGIVGLSSPQADYVENMRRRLRSGDSDEMLKVLGRFKDGKWVEGTGQTLRDRRYDAQIKRAIRDVAAGKPNPLAADKIDEMVARYSDRLLKRRAEDIARTETAQGVEMARAEATKQALVKVGLPDDAVVKTWVHQGGIRHARDGHLALNGKQVQGVDAVFFLPDGSIMLYPHDPAGGVKNNANCRCRGDHAIDWAFGL